MKVVWWYDGKETWTWICSDCLFIQIVIPCLSKCRSSQSHFPARTRLMNFPTFEFHKYHFSALEAFVFPMHSVIGSHRLLRMRRCWSCLQQTLGQAVEVQCRLKLQHHFCSSNYSTQIEPKDTSKSEKIASTCHFSPWNEWRLACIAGSRTIEWTCFFSSPLPIVAFEPRRTEILQKFPSHMGGKILSWTKREVK